MCGINGVFAFGRSALPVDRGELLRTRDFMAARGPDAAGDWVSQDERVGFGHRRLSIIDLSEAGAQPMFSADRKLAVTFNGEIYNYEELRLGLQARGHVFRSNSDTEVLLHLYARRGADMVRELRGMFAFAIWDTDNRKLLLARDPYGIKPLYYADDGSTFRFASQVKALLAGGSVSSEPDPAGAVGFCLFGSVPEPFTMYRGVRALPAGSTLEVSEAGAAAASRYHSIAQVYHDAEARKLARGVDVAGELRAALVDSVRHHLVADVPVGAFLSSGINSSALVGLMRDAGQSDIQTITLAFSEFAGRPEDEAPLAAQVAKIYGTRHSTRFVGEEEFQADLPAIVRAMDQPTIDGLNTWFVAKAARERGLKVAISGLGGDELFCGYPSFQDIPKWVRSFGFAAAAPSLGRAARIVGGPLIAAFGANSKAAGMLEYGGTYPGAYLLRRGLFMPWQLREILARDVAEEGLRRLEPLALIEREMTPPPAMPTATVSALESALYMKNQLLRDTDWASMAHSIEVRTPLVDAILLAKAAGVAAASGIALSKSYIAEAPMRPLPSLVKTRAKTGFMTPIAEWRRRSSFGRMSDGAAWVPAKTYWARDWAKLLLASGDFLHRDMLADGPAQ